MSIRAARMSPQQMAQAVGLLTRVLKTIGSESVANAIPRRKAIVFMNVLAAKQHGAEVDEVAAQRAVDALRRIHLIMTEGNIPTTEDLPSPEDREALETCIRFMRPSILVKNDHIGQSKQLAWTENQQGAIESLLPGIGSIGYKEGLGFWGNSPSRMGIATCFAVGPRLVLTCIHVLDQIQNDRRKLGDVIVRFDVEYDMPERRPVVAVKRELIRHPMNDVVILELESDCPLPDGLTLAENPTLSTAQHIVVIGHPLRDVRNPRWAQLMFDGKFGVKRVSPGDILDLDKNFVYHDASTLGGNSGSPIVDVATGRVVAVHSQGEFALRNEAVSTGAIASEKMLRDVILRWA